MRKICFLFACVVLASCLLAGCGKGNIVINSPDGRIRVKVTDTALVVSYNRTEIQTVRMNIEGSESFYFDRNPKKLLYEMISGKRSECFNSYREVLLRANNGNSLILRACNDGVAFRFIMGDGYVSYVIPEGRKRWLQTLRTDYEGFYPESTGARDGTYAYPALVEYGDGVFGLITESDVAHGHGCSHLVCKGEDYTVLGDDNVDNGLNPFRIIMIGSLADIVESTLVTDVAVQCQIQDTSWIKPGVSSWIYWANNHGSKDFNKVKEYIDLAHDMHWPYTLIDWEWDEMSGGGNIDDALAYARERGVKVNLWYNSGTSWIGPGAPGPQDRLRTADAREREMTRLEEMGVTGIKVDFFLPDKSDMVDYYLDILEDAARHHLLVDFHGCTVPRGWNRTWPNLMSMEAVYGAEWYNNNRRMTNAAAAHNATLPFTRNVIGPMDYTPCTFTDSQNPHITTDCHELALPILFESGLQHMADRPEAYLGLPEQIRELLSGLPSAWNDTRLLAGYPAESAVIARRYGDTWYIAGINGTENEITLEPDYSRIGKDVTLSMLVTDKGDKPGMGFNIENDVKAGKITLAPRGGFVAIVRL